MPDPLKKQYLGDAVYMDDDGYHLVLTTENGLTTTNEIYIEPSSFDALLEYIRRFKEVRNA